MLEFVLAFGALILTLCYSSLLMLKPREKLFYREVWRFITNYLAIMLFLYILISLAELSEFFAIFSEGLFDEVQIYIFIVIPGLIALHIYAIKKYLELSGVGFENVDLRHIGVPFFFAVSIWVVIEEILAHSSLYFAIKVISELAYIFSIPIMLIILYFTFIEKRFEDEIIVSPLESIDKIALIPLSASVFCIAILAKLSGLSEMYNLLEGISLIMFVISGEVYRRLVFSLKEKL